MALPAIPAAPPARRPTRPRITLVGTALASAGTFMAFASLIGVYLAVRSQTIARSGIWFPKGTTIPLTPANITLFTFALSIVSMQWAVHAVGRGDHQHAGMALLLTLLFGASTINATSFLWSQMGLSVRSSAAGVLVYVITGAHVAMTVAAMVYAAVMTFRTLGGDYTGRDREGIAAAALFWYVTCAVYVLVWYAIYVTK
ncbi:MAG: cytochrome c oxidase subunit 3 [Actinobacteria bacterium]|nr:cytochrome c oxidase subunit 3 [Actinomycetota bacterium]